LAIQGKLPGMNTSTAHILFGFLSIIFLAGVFIMVRNEIIIRNFANVSGQKVKGLSSINLVVSKVQIQNNFNLIMSQPAFKIPVNQNNNTVPLLIQLKSTKYLSITLNPG